MKITKIYIVLAVSVLVWTGGGVRAADPVSLVVTPEEALQKALEHSPALKMAGEAVAAATARQRQAAAQGLPTLDVSAYASRYAGLEDSVFGPNNVIPAIETRLGAYATLQQPLYTGGRISSQKAGASSQRQSAEWQGKAAHADVMLQVLTAYWSWSKAVASVGALTDSLAWMEAHARDMKNLQEAGMATENEALATEVQKDQTRLRLEETRHRVELARARLTYWTGVVWPEDARPLQAKESAETPPDREETALQSAYSNRPERAAARMDVQGLESAVQARRAGYHPQLFAQARYEQLRPNPLNIPPADEWQDDGFVGAVMSWNIFDAGLTRAQVAEATAQLQQARWRAEQEDESIALEVRQARIGWDDARTRVRVAGSAVQSAELNLTSATDQWENGIARHSEVLDAQARLTDAQFEWAAAKADVELAAATWRHAVGELAQETK